MIQQLVPWKVLFECRGTWCLWKMKEHNKELLRNLLINWGKTLFHLDNSAWKGRKALSAFLGFARSSPWSRFPEHPAVALVLLCGCPPEQGPALWGCQVLCCREPGKSSGVPGGEREGSKQLFLPSWFPAKNKRDSSCTRENTNQCLVGIHELFWCWLVTFFLLLLLTCCFYSFRLMLLFCHICSRSSPWPHEVSCITVKKCLHLEGMGATEWL